MQIFEQLPEACSQNIKIDKSQVRYSLDSIKDCGDKECINLIVFLENFDSFTLDSSHIIYQVLCIGMK